MTDLLSFAVSGFYVVGLIIGFALSLPVHAWITQRAIQLSNLSLFRGSSIPATPQITFLRGLDLAIPLIVFNWVVVKTIPPLYASMPKWHPRGLPRFTVAIIGFAIVLVLIVFAYQWLFSYMLNLSRKRGFAILLCYAIIAITIYGAFALALYVAVYVA